MKDPWLNIDWVGSNDNIKYLMFFIKCKYFSDDHTLVQLRPLPGPGQRRPDYINASFIDGFQKSRAYIATQVWTSFPNR